jgi:glycosyltransferase involved in cell wall biosynthesis
VAALRKRIEAILALEGEEREAIRAAARRAAVELWSWKSVARRIVATVEA